jgi:hypothetical protein
MVNKITEDLDNIIKTSNAKVVTNNKIGLIFVSSLISIMGIYITYIFIFESLLASVIYGIVPFCFGIYGFFKIVKISMNSVSLTIQTSFSKKTITWDSIIGVYATDYRFNRSIILVCNDQEIILPHIKSWRGADRLDAIKIFKENTLKYSKNISDTENSTPTSDKLIRSSKEVALKFTYLDRAKFGTWLYITAAVTLINIILNIFVPYISLMLGLSSAHIVQNFATFLYYELNSFIAPIIGYSINIFSILVFLGLGFLSRKGILWAYILGIILYGIDIIGYIFFLDFLSVFLHVLILMYMTLKIIRYYIISYSN